VTRQRITLIHHPTVALKVSGFSTEALRSFNESGIYLGNVYRRIMPASLPRVASVMERHLPVDVRILDLRIAGCDQETTYNSVNWEGYNVEVKRVGGAFELAGPAIEESDWVGFSSHFTYESGVVRDLIRYAKQLKPSVKVMVGGADVKARPMDYLRFGADLVCTGDFNPEAISSHTQPTIAGQYRHPFGEMIAPAFEKLERLMDYSDSHDGPVPDGVDFPIGFLHFTRGCPRECDFCESRRTKFEVMVQDAAIEMIENYRAAGIKSLNFADDNLLLLAATRDGRKRLIELFQVMRGMGFAWEFPNGLEIGRLMVSGHLDDELIDAMFTHTVHPDTGSLVGAYRLYAPLETFDQRDRYSKLKPVEIQNSIISRLAATGLPEIDFGVVIPPDADLDTFLNIAVGYREIRSMVERNGNSRARYALFHLIPIALYRDMHTKYSVDEFPEGWNFYFPVYDGTHLSARELFEHRLRVVQEIDHANFASMAAGKYSYS